MAIRLSGLISGMDTDAMVQELVSAYSTKKDKYVKAQTKLEWKQDAWKALNTKIYSFYSKSLSNMRFSNAFNKKVSSSSSAKATVTASSDAVIGTQSLKISQLAKSGYLTGGVVRNVNDGTGLSGSSKLSDLGITDNSTFTVTADGKTTNIEINGDTTINQFVVNLKDAGVNANFDETNQRFFISAKNSGEAGDFSLNATNGSGLEALKSLGLMTSNSADASTYKKMAEYDVDALTDAAYEKKKGSYTTVEEMTEILTKAIESSGKDLKSMNSKKEILDFKIDYSQMDNEDKKSVTEELNSRLKELKAKNSKDLTSEEKNELSVINKKLAAIKESDKAIGADTLTDEDRQKYIDELQKQSDEMESDIDNITKSIEDNQAILDGTADETLGYTDISSYVEKYNADVDVSNEALKEQIHDDYAARKALGQEMTAAYDVVNQYSSIHNPTAEQTEAYNEAMNKLGIAGNTAVRIEGADAKITLNGAEFTSTTNSFSINGLTIQATALTDPDEVISITTDQDTQGIYDMVKGFLKDYNELINEMDSLFNASSAKGYEPLTDDEKEAMTDKEIEKWETKIKDSLLRRDSTLDAVTTAMKSAMSASFDIDGVNYSLSSFGINTLGYFVSGENEKGAYHIDGDSEDSATSGNTDKLLKAIANNPDTVQTFFNELAGNLYTQLSNKMKSSSVSSAYTVYNDKQMKTEYDEYKDVIKSWEEKITKYEEKYRKQFTAMEKALSTLNSQQTQLSNLLGS